MTLRSLDNHVGKNAAGSFLISHTKINSRPKNERQSREAFRGEEKKLSFLLWHRKEYLKMEKLITIKEKNDKFEYIKFSFTKDTIKRDL